MTAAATAGNSAFVYSHAGRINDMNNEMTSLKAEIAEVKALEVADATDFSSKNSVCSFA